MFKKNINDVRQSVIKFLNLTYPENNINESNLMLLNEGKFANATVFHYLDSNLNLTIKDFSGSPWIIRKTFGKLFINMEYNTLIKLSNNSSVAKDAKKLSPHTLAFNFIEGEALKTLPKNSIDKDFFLELEKNVRAMHRKDIVHLDLRNLGNILKGNDGYPYIIDFQSAISTKYLGKWLTQLLKTSDLTGVYKCWNNRCTEPLNSKRNNILEEFNKIRKVWIFKGYPISRAIKKFKEFITQKKLG